MRRRMLELKMKVSLFCFLFINRGFFQLCDWTVGLTVASLLIAMSDIELSANPKYAKKVSWSYGQLELTSVPCIILCSTCCMYISHGSAWNFSHHVSLHGYQSKQRARKKQNLSQIYLIETGTHHWRIAFTSERLSKILFELLICSICPIPGELFCQGRVENRNKRTSSLR